MILIGEPLEGLDSLVTVPEPDLVRAIFHPHGWIGSVGVPPQTPYPVDWKLHVEPAELGLPPHRFGDIDALVVPSGSPSLARAVQFKRVKITSHTFETGELNKLNELPKLVAQANATRKAGFAFVWLSVLVVADMRSQVRAPSQFPSPTGELMDRVYSALPLSELDDSIGVAIHQICQVSDQPANHRGLAGGHMLRGARKEVQAPAVTEGVAKLFERLAAAGR